MAPNTTPTTRAKIVALKKAGKSYSEIKDKLEGHCVTSRCQIIRIYQQYGEKENYYNVGHSSGQPPLMNVHDKRVATHHLSNCDAKNATDLQRQFFPDWSVKTVKKALRDCGLGAHIRHSVPFISNPNLKKQRQWAEDFENWTAEDWRCVNFSDESIFRVFGSDGIEWCWRKASRVIGSKVYKEECQTWWWEGHSVGNDLVVQSWPHCLHWRKHGLFPISWYIGGWCPRKLPWPWSQPR